jgi:hypothetical protein
MAGRAPGASLEPKLRGVFGTFAKLDLGRCDTEGMPAHLESPVGSQPRRGFAAARSQVWDEAQPATIHTRHLIVSGTSVAVLTENVVAVDGGTISVFSIDTYDFDEAGNCSERNYFSMPG